MIKENNQISIQLEYSKYIVFAFILAILSILLLKVNWYIIFIPFLIFPLIIYGEKTLIFYAIISFLSLTSTVSIELRTIVQIVFLILLYYLFLKEYGLNFSLYPKIPRQISILLLLLYSSMIFSTIFSNYVFLGIKEIIRLTIFLVIVYFFYGFLFKTKNIGLFLLALFFVGLFFTILPKIILALLN